MDTVNFLEQLAKNTSYGEETHKLISEQPNEIQKAYLENDAEFIKNKFSNVGYLATATQVIEI
jgi:hypothetical protein